MLQKVHIKQNEENLYKVEVLVDGVNIANRICGYTLTQEPACVPVLTVESSNLTFEYDGLAEVIDKTAHEEIKRLKENITVLDKALRKYQEKYGD